MIYRSRAAGLLVAAALLTTACGGETPAAPAAAQAASGPVTSNFTGRLVPGGAATHAFVSAGTGAVQVTLADLSSSSGAGIGVGQLTNAGCTLLGSRDDAEIGSVLEGWVVDGSYCVLVYDSGRMQAAADYRLTVTHP